MLHKMSVFLVAAVGLLCLSALGVGCEPDNENEVDCLDGDCKAACAEKGFAGGTCVDESLCQCDGTDVGAYDWDESPPAAIVDAGPDAN